MEAVMNKKILIMGLPGSGKTTLARYLALKLKAVHFNADEVRSNINKDLGFSIEDRIEHARRMGWLCDQVTKADHWALADFVCPTKSTREAFGPAFVIWMNTINEGRFEDTNRMFEYPNPDEYDVCIMDFDAENHAEYIFRQLRHELLPNIFEVN
jgi:adenylylsulfate kinase